MANDPNLPLDDNDLILVDRYDAATGGRHTAINGAAMRSWTGWADYADTQYTEGSPFQPTPLIWTPVPNNAGGGPRSQRPLDGEGNPIELFENGKITGRNGDGILILIEMTVKPTTASATTLDIAVDIGGAIGRLYEQRYNFPKGQNVEQTIAFTVNAYTLDTWQANGGQVQVNPSHAVDIYNHRVLITRTHKART